LVVIVSPGSATISTPARVRRKLIAAELRGSRSPRHLPFDGSGIRVTVVHGGTLYRAVITVPPGAIT